MKVKVAFCEKQSAKKNNSYSPSATKPALVMDAWCKSGIVFDLVNIKPSTRKDISSVHSRKMVSDILDLKRANGFSNKLPEVAEALPWVCGSMVSAVDDVIQYGGVCFSPTSGAHHAGYNFTGGFCTFNFLAMAAKHAYDNYGCRVGILDCDAHYGNGTADIIKRFDWKWIVHHSVGSSYGKHKAYLAHLKTALAKFENVDVMIYNAGADPHENDPLGGMLSTEELMERDRIVLEFCRERNIPTAISLAGGYQDNIKDVIEIHVNTFKVADELWENSFDIGDIIERKKDVPIDIFNDQLDLGFDDKSRSYPCGDFLNAIDDVVELFSSEMSRTELNEYLEIYLRSFKNRS